MGLMFSLRLFLQVTLTAEHDHGPTAAISNESRKLPLATILACQKQSTLSFQLFSLTKF